MSDTILAGIAGVRASLDELEQALQAAETARARYHQAAGTLLQQLGAPRPPERLALPAPAAEPTPPPASVAAPRAPKSSPPRKPTSRKPRATAAPKAAPVPEPRATATAPAPETEACEKHSRRSRCRGPVQLVVKCREPGCDWSCSRCVAHPAKSAAHVLRAHVRYTHGRGPGRARGRGRRKAPGRADEPRRPAAVARPLSRRELIAQRARAVATSTTTAVNPSAGPRRGQGARRCSNCGEPGHRAPGCPRPPGGDMDDSGEQRPAAAALDVAGLSELDGGYDAEPRAVSYGVEE